MTTTEGERPVGAPPATGQGRGAADEASVVSMLSKCASGEVEALSDLYDATSTLVYRLSLMVLGDEGRASSSTHRTYRTLWEQSAGYDRSRQGSALSWLVTVAYTHARSAVA